MSEAIATPTQPQPSAPTDSENGSGVFVRSLDERMAATFGSDDPNAGQSTAADSPAEGTAPAAPAAPELDANAKARAERRAALAKLQSEERAKVDAMAALRERDELRAKLAALEAQPKLAANLVDPSKLTKEQFLALAEQHPELSPRELGEWLRERMANPELAAAQAATKAVDPKITALEKKLADQQAIIDNFLNAQKASKEEAEEQQAAEQLYAFTRENAATAPYSAWFLQEHGSQYFYKVALDAASRVPPGAGPQAILDETEELLILAYGKRPPELGNTQRRQASPTQPNPAAAQAPTHVTNTLAQQRSSVVNEDENWAQLPFEERSARLFR